MTFQETDPTAKILSEVGSAAEKANVTANIGEALDGVRKSILPDQAVKAGAEKATQMIIGGASLALLVGVFSSGFYMVTTGKPAPWMRKFLSKES